MDRCQVAEQALRHRMALLVGALLAFAAGLFARASGLDRDRAFYPTVAIVIASYYSLFAVMGASTRALVLESLVAGAFVAVAILGFRSSLWVVVIALGAHGVFDLAHGNVMSNPGGYQGGGQRSVSRTLPRQQGTWRGCSRADVFVLFSRRAR
jgi:hypothetical protein